MVTSHWRHSIKIHASEDSFTVDSELKYFIERMETIKYYKINGQTLNFCVHSMQNAASSTRQPDNRSRMEL